MFVAVMMAGALALGYTAAVVISMLLTFAMTMSIPKFVESDFLIRGSYKLLHEAFWFVGVGVGGFLTALVVKGFHPLVTEAGLAAALIWVLWDNSWEARQRGTAHQVLITVLTLVGVGGGYILERQML